MAAPKGEGSRIRIGVRKRKVFKKKMLPALDSPIIQSVHIDMEVSPNSLSMFGSHNSSDVFEGKNVTVTCVATGAKPPAYIYWNSDPELFQV